MLKMTLCLENLIETASIVYDLILVRVNITDLMLGL